MVFSNGKNIAILIPCLNEEKTIGKVINDFRTQLPDSRIIVFDNLSTDASARIASEHKAEVIRVPRRGKGFVIESMFDCVQADIYIVVDGDDTYPADYVHKLIEPVLRGDADMVVGARLANREERSFSGSHLLGNKLVCFLVNWVTNASLTDIMSGYRAFNSKVTELIPVVSCGFEVETELTFQMLYYKRKIAEIAIPYKRRPDGSYSKLNTLRDGIYVLWKIFSFFRAFKPFTFFGGVGLILMFLGIIAGMVPVHDYLTSPNHFVSHIPLAILAVGLVTLSAGCIFLGILLHAINWRFLELHNVLTRKKMP
jgi:glycosyltransferase involved in cell wall biosynthesis